MKSEIAIEMLKAFLPNGLPVLMTGAPGVGKSSIVASICNELGMDLITDYPALSDPTDSKGMPWVSAGNADFIPFGTLRKVLSATSPTVWFLDDLGQATPAVQASYMQWLLAREVNGNRLPDCVSIVAATNRRSDKAGVSGILAPVISRFASVIEIEPDVQSWANWAIGEGLNTHVIAFNLNRPELHSVETIPQGIENFPCPRTWHFASKIVNLNLPKSLQTSALSGCVGQGAAVEFAAFQREISGLVTIDQILIDPTHAPLPSSPVEGYVISTGIAGRSDPKTFPQFALYIERMLDNGQEPYGVLAFRGCTRRENGITSLREYITLASGKLAKVMFDKE